MRVSDHTILINMMIGLSKQVKDWPSTLRENGYVLDTIEPKFHNSDGDIVNPDLLFSSNRFNHVLINECKGGNGLSDQSREHLEDQIEKYLKITKESLLYELGLIREPSKLTFDISLACNPALDEQIRDYTIATLVFFDNKLSKRNDFNNSILQQAFNDDILINGYPPLSFYPYSDQDPESIIALAVFGYLFSKTLRNGTSSIDISSEEIAENTHVCWRNVQSSQKRRIIDRINNILLSYERDELKGYLRKISNKGDWKVTKSTEAFRKRCQTIIDDLNNRSDKEGLSGFFDL